MADKQGHYWDHNEARWVRYPARPAKVDVPVEIPAQQAPVASEQEADVRSG